MQEALRGGWAEGPGGTDPHSCHMALVLSTVLAQSEHSADEWMNEPGSKCKFNRGLCLFCLVSSLAAHQMVADCWLLRLEVPCFHLGNILFLPPTVTGAPHQPGWPMAFHVGAFGIQKHMVFFNRILLFLFMFLSNLFFLLLQNNTC